MTIAVAISTLSAIVFAADSKLTTYGRVGYDKDGEAIVVPQTYDNATKIVADGTRTGMAAVIGSATLGQISFMDYIASHALPSLGDADQEAALRAFVQGMATLRTEYWGDVAEREMAGHGTATGDIAHGFPQAGALARRIFRKERYSPRADHEPRLF